MYYFKTFNNYSEYEAYKNGNVANPPPTENKPTLKNSMNNLVSITIFDHLTK